MKRIFILLLVLALLLPTLAFASDEFVSATDITTAFDFTTAEWMERYTKLVPEDDALYFTAFEETGSIEPYLNYGGMDYEKHYFSELAYLRIISHPSAQNPSVIQFALSTDDLPGSNLQLSEIEPKLAFLRDVVTYCMRATKPELTEAEILATFKEMNVMEANYEILSSLDSPKTVSLSGIDYDFAGGNWLYVTIIASK